MSVAFVSLFESHSMMLFFNTAKKLIRYFIPVVLFISIVLLGFLLAGCSINSSNFSSVYLIELNFNQTSGIFPQITSLSQNSSSLSNMTIRVGYLGMCLDLNGNLTCSTNGQIAQMLQGTSIKIPGLPASVDMVGLGSTFSSICHPYMLIATLAISLILFFLILWSSAPFLPWKSNIKKIVCVFAFANILTWGLGSMLQEEAITAAKKIVGPASMNILDSSSGTRSIAMTWTAFAFILIVLIGSFISLILENKQTVNVERKF